MAETPKNPVQYAEQTLGVHTVYDQASALLAEVDGARADVVRTAHELRRLREQLADREADLVTDERVSNPDMSATAFEKHLPVAKQRDPELKKLRAQLIATQYDHDGFEAVVKVLDRKLDVAGARMAELGGLLQFFAAVKNASISVQAPPPHLARQTEHTT